MRRIKTKVVYMILAISLLGGCGFGKSKYEPILPEEYLEIDFEDWESSSVEEDNCQTFTYEGRQYLFYSIVSDTIYEEDVDECVGCVVYDGEAYKEEMILVLSYSDSKDYLLRYVNGPDLMGIPIEVYRATDTKGEDIKTPDFIEPPIEGNSMYQYWEESE